MFIDQYPNPNNKNFSINLILVRKLIKVFFFQICTYFLGDSFYIYNGMIFSTADFDNDEDGAKKWKSGWWFFRYISISLSIKQISLNNIMIIAMTKG